MAGITDRPFRQLCRRFGAGLTVSEMVSSKKTLRNSEKTRLRCDHHGEMAPIAVQILGTDPQQMAEAAQWNVAQGAQIIDINMGCPAKKVCNVLAGSALLRDELKVSHILESVVNAVQVPVTVKIRTGWDSHNKNAERIAYIAENAGIQAITVHGRTRACAYKGNAEYDTIAKVKAQVNIAVIANGDIDSAQKADTVLQYTQADAIMIGRAAQGRPWIFREINDYLRHNKAPAPISTKLLFNTVTEHIQMLYQFYGSEKGVQIARKHIFRYLQHLQNTHTFWHSINHINNAQEQYQRIQDFFSQEHNYIT